MSEKTLPEAGRAFVFRTPEGRKGASGTIWGKILCAEGQTGGKQVYPLSRREAKKLIPVNVSLELGTVTTDVTIRDAPLLFETTEARVSSLIGEALIDILPLQGRNFYSLVVLTAGVTGLPSGAGGGQAYAQWSADIFNSELGLTQNANGQRGESNSYLIDSSSVNASPRGGVVNLSPNSDSVQELRVSVNNFSAEHERNSSLVVNVATKSGSNDLHGTASWFHTNNALTSRNVFQRALNDDGTCTILRHDESCDALPVFRRNEISGSLGGPIRRDRTFFFASMDTLRSGVGTTFVTQVPSLEFMSFLQNNPRTTNNVSTEIVSRFLPEGTRGSTNRTVGGEEFRIALKDENGAPLNPLQCDPTSNIFNGNYRRQSSLGPPAMFPCSMSLTQNLTYNNVIRRNGAQQSFRVDHNWNSAKQRIYFNFYHTHRDTVNFGVANVYPDFDGRQPEYSYYFNVNYTHTLAPTVVFESSVAVTRVRGDIGIAHGEIPNINVPGISSYGMGFSGPTFIQTNGEWRNVLSWMRGKHSFKFGSSLAIEEGWKSGAQFGQEWTRYFFQFDNQFDFALDDPFQESNYGIDPVTGSQAGRDFLPAFPRAGLFVNDDWRVKPSLTLSLALRWEYFGIPYEQSASHNFSGIVFRGGSDFFSRIADAGVQKKSPLDSRDINNFAPRFGIAWDPTGKGRISVRGGIGIFYDRAAGQFYGDCCATLPVFAIVTARKDQPGPQPNFGIGSLTTPPWGYPAMTGIVPGLDSRGGLASARANVGVWDPNLRTQYATNWFLGIQYALSTNWAIDANYVGSTGRKLYQEYDVNRVNGNLLDGVFDRNNPSFGAFGFGQANGSSSYNGANLTVRKRYSHGLACQLAYTVGRAVDTASSFGRGLVFPDIYNLNLNRGLADFDVRHKLAGSLLYELPSPRDGMGLLGKTLGGWQIGAVTIAQAGQPFSVFCTASRSGGCDWNADGFNYDRPHEASFGSFVKVTKDELLSSDGIFNVAGGQGLSIFPAPAVGTNGSLGRNTFIGPGYFATDLNLQKNTKIPWFWGTEGATIQLRTEMYNAFNQTGINFLALRRLRVYTRLPAVGPSEHKIFSQMVPPASSRLFRVPKARWPGFQNHLFATTLHSWGIAEPFFLSATACAIPPVATTPRSAPTYWQTAAASDGSLPTGASSTVRVLRAGLPFSPTVAGGSSTTTSRSSAAAPVAAKGCPNYRR